MKRNWLVMFALASQSQVFSYLRFYLHFICCSAIRLAGLTFLPKYISVKLLLCTAVVTLPDVCLLSQNTNPPADSARQLQTVQITAPAIRDHTPGERNQSWDAQALQAMSSSHLGELLAAESGVFVKSYGLGSSATTSIRGGSAGHTQVIWNGLPIDNPMLGQLDFSLMPISLVDNVAVAFGGNSASWGSGAIGGTVFLKNEFSPKKGLRVNGQTEMGSFGWQSHQLKLQYSDGQWQQDLRLTRQLGDNDFSYSVSPVLPKRKQENAALKQNAMQYGLSWCPHQDQEFSLRTWWQKTDREIPPTTVQNRSEAQQSDAFVRTVLSWKRIGSNGLFSAKTGIFKENQEYLDPLINLRAANDFWKLLAEVEQEWQFNQKQKIQIGLNNPWIESDSKSYGQAHQQNRTAIFASLRQQVGDWSGQLNARQELVDGKPVPFVPSLGIHGTLTDWLELNSKLSRNYRLPTLNDLFWEPGGNEELVAETGWSEEVGLNSTFGKTPFRLTYSITAFNRNIDNWIQWSIRDGGSFYSPENITSVWSRGIEQHLGIQFQVKKTNFHLRSGYDFIKSTYQEAVSTPRFDKGEQLIYTPEHQVFGSFSINRKSVSLKYQHRATGEVDTQNVGILPGYQVASLRIENNWSYRSWKARLFLTIENLWDSEYRVIERRAMPGRYFRLGVRIEN